MREFACICRIEADKTQQFLDTGLTIAAIFLKPEDPQRLGKYAANSPAWIETCVGILKDHLDSPAMLPASG